MLLLLAGADRESYRSLSAVVQALMDFVAQRCRVTFLVHDNMPTGKIVVVHHGRNSNWNLQERFIALKRS